LRNLWLGSRLDIASKLLADGVLLSLCYLGAFLIRFDGRVPAAMWQVCLLTLPWIVALKLCVYLASGLYRSFWRYSGVNDLQRLLVAMAGCLGTSLFVVTMSREATFGFPRGIYLVDAFLALAVTGGLRFSPRWLRETVPSAWLRPVWGVVPGLRRKDLDRRKKRVLIVGAGDEGEAVVSELIKSGSGGEYVAVAIVDEDTVKRGRLIHGVPVVGVIADIPRLVEQMGVEEIVITRHSDAGDEVRPVLRVCRGVKARLRIVPTLSEIVGGAARLTDIRDVKLEDLLRREEAKLDLDQISGYLRGRRILVTGAGGSIGSELCRQIARFEPAQLVLFGRGEHSIFVIDQELSLSFPGVRRATVIGDVINKKKLQGVFATYRPEIVFHAGADKHVPLMEGNPDEAVLNNVFGTKNLLEVCEASDVHKIVCISTDKAVNPTSVMGACKRVAEIITQGRTWSVPAVVVRFGNVLGSRGSVIPTFCEQIRRGGPVTVTHPEMKRFFMTIPEAAKLVIQAGAIGQGGEAFVLDMGDQVRISDLAREMIQLAGFDPEREIQIKYVGVRPGEKLYEELSERSEDLKPTSHPKIRRVAHSISEPPGFELHLRDLYHAALEMNEDRIMSVLGRIIPTYHSSRAVPPVAARERIAPSVSPLVTLSPLSSVSPVGAGTPMALAAGER
jgi:FlaA1/EpsC-like NDP-sugar epimerase